MKRRVAILALLVLTSAGVAAYLVYDGTDDPHRLPGYMDAKLVLVAPEDSGRLTSLNVEEGDSVGEGAALFTLESRVQQATVAAAEARLREAETALELSRLGFQRAKELRRRNVAPQARLDEARAVFERDKAALEAVRAALAEMQTRLGQRIVAAPVSGIVHEVYFRPGEVAGAGRPVVALLPPGNMRLRFYLPQPQRAGLRIGDVLGISCDGCPEGLTARVGFISRQAEFTPPIVFTREVRGKLVYLIEARPDERAAQLAAGQPVTVALARAQEARAEARGP